MTVDSKFNPSVLSGSLRSGLMRSGMALFLLAATQMVSDATAQMVGPPPPRPAVRQESPVVNAIGRFIKGNRTEKPADARGSAGSQNTAGAASSPSEKSLPEKPVVKLPPEIENPAPPIKPEGPLHAPLLTQPPLTTARVEPPEVDAKNPPLNDHPRLNDPTNPLGFTEAENRLRKYAGLIDAKRYDEAKPGMLQLRQWLVDLTEAHIGLYKTLNQVPSARAQAELEKELALQFAQLRDRAFMDTARIYIAEKDYNRAIKELTDVVKSQPRSKLGLRSYQMLQEIGFTEKLQLAQ